MIYDYLVIGAGISGLVTASILAQDGFKVALFERSEKIAPVVRGFSRNGVHFDTGFHYSGGLGKGEILDRIFRYIGIADDLDIFPFQKDGFDIFRDADTGEEFRFPVGYGPLAEVLNSVNKGDRQEVDQYLRVVQKTCDNLPFLNQDVKYDPFRGLHGATLLEVLEKHISDPYLRYLLSLHTLLYGTEPSGAPFELHAGVVGLYYKSVHGIKGGGAALIKVFKNRIEELGVKLINGRAVRKILFTDAGDINGVELDDGEIVPGRSCVATVHPKTFLEMVPEKFHRPAYRKRILGLKDTPSAYLLFAKCKEPIPMIKGANLFLGNSQNTISDTAGPLDWRTIYITHAHSLDSRDGAGGVVAICPTTAASTARWSESSRKNRPEAYLRFKANIMSQLQKRIEDGFPEIKGKIQFIAGATPLTIRDFTGNLTGSLYGVKHSIKQYNPQIRTSVPGLFLAGQGTVAPGVLGSALSAVVSCGYILGHNKLQRELWDHQ
ncbi:MAG: NAD(P)/FAD-dependent oxidoreductase [Thermovirgaceae bacterium]|nr:NAD(P)/FAD-dependent oxidoreductase [Thermovirgaceae bacterium]